MKILHTVQLYEPHKGGSEEVVKQISERLVARGHDVTVATAKSPLRKTNEIQGVKIAEFEVSGNAAGGISGDASGYLNFIRQWDGDVMMNYAAQIWTTDLLLDHLGELEFRKVLVPCGYSGLNRELFAPYFEALPHRISAYDALVYPSPNYQDYEFGEKHGLGGKAVVIPNGAAEEEFLSQSTSFRTRYGITSRHMILTVSNHYRVKGHHHLLAAIRDIPDATLVIIGNAEDHRRPWKGCFLRCSVASLASNRVKCLRGLPRSDVVEAFQAADVFALASDLECAPVVIYEAMASGTPFVSVRCGNVADNSQYGVVVDDPRELAPALSSLLGDPARLSAMGQGGRQAWIENYTWDRITDQYESLYRQLVSGERVGSN